MPRYLKLVERLSMAISMGRFQPGELLPSEPDLAVIHKVSRTTIRQALAVLELEGYVRRERGRGTIVSQQLVRHPLLSFDDDMARQGVSWSRDIIDRRLVRPPGDIRNRLELPTAERVLFVRERRVIGDRPCSLNERYIKREFRSAYQAEVERGTVFYTLLVERSGSQAYAAMELRVGPAPPPQARLLAIKRGSLVLLARFVHFLNGTKPIEVVDAFYPTDRWRFVFQRLALIDPSRHMATSVDPRSSTDSSLRSRSEVDEPKRPTVSQPR